MHTTLRHQCIIYEGPPQFHLQSLALTIIGKLKGGKRCLYLNSPEMVEGMKAALTQAGLDAQAEIDKGSLILTSDQSHLVNQDFDTDIMINMLRTALEQALADGYVGLWATGDMSWEFGDQANFTKLFEYERKLEAFIQMNPELSGVCQYCRDHTPPHAIETARHTHQAFYIDDVLTHINPEYLPLS